MAEYLTNRRTGERVLCYDCWEMQDEFDVCERTIYRWSDAGMPTIRLGRKYTRYPIVACRDWIEQNHPEAFRDWY